MIEQPGPEGPSAGGGAAIPQAGEPRSSRGTKLRAFWPILGGLVLIVGALLGGFLLPVAKDCLGAFEYQSRVSRTFAICKEASGPFAFVWLAVIVVGAAVILFGIFRTYYLPRASVPVGRVSARSTFAAAPPPDASTQQATDRVLDWTPDPAAPAGEMREVIQSAKRRLRKWPYVVAIAMLAVVVLCLGALYAYSTNSADEWRATADKTTRDLESMTALRDGLSEKNATLTSELSEANRKLNDTMSQLNDATARIRALANEKAQLGDRTAGLVVEAVVLQEIVDASQNVSTRMSVCIDELQNLQSHLVNLVNYSAYDQSSLISFVRDINSQCNTARTDSDSLTQKIRGLR